MKRIFQSAAMAAVLTVCFAGQSRADQWDYLYAKINQQIQSHYGPNSGYNIQSIAMFDNAGYNCPLSSDVQQFFSPPTCGGLGSDTLNINIFASQQEFDALNNQFAALNSQFATLNNEFTALQTSVDQLRFAVVQSRQLSWSIGAMASAFDTGMPADGATNRFSIGASTAGGAQAVSLNYVHVVNDVDLHAGFASDGHNGIGRVSVGLSW